MKNRYLESFDGLRGMAVMLLMGYHGSYGFLKGGVPRVDLFSVMSGYLITMLLYREYQATGNIDFKKFYIRRALRLLPALFACVLLSYFLWPYSAETERGDRMLATMASLFYFSNLITDYLLGNMNHLWSLAVEEHFYFVWPFFTYFFLFRLSDKNRLIALGGVVIFLQLFRLAAFFNQDQWHHGIFLIDPYAFTLCRSDCIVLGAMLFFVLYRKQFNYGWPESEAIDKYILSALALIFIVSALALSWTGPFWLMGGFTITNMIVTGTVLMAVRNPNNPVMTTKLFTWVGKRSYGIYLYHMPIFLFMERYRIHHSYLNLAIVTLARFSVSIGVAALSYQYLELPLLRVKERFKVKVNRTVEAT
ncbi:MAG: acyltransferase [Chryseolinea sp.]